MLTDGPTAHEPDRLAALDRYDILDTPCEETFDRITRLTRRLFDVPMSTITLIDERRQWFKSRVGIAMCETPREPALCNLAIRQSDPLIVGDALADARLRINPFVVGPPNIRFYAGAPLLTPDGHAIGTLCAMDTKPRGFLDDDAETLADLARIVMSELELRRLAMIDGLTGTLSRHAFREELSRAFALAMRHGHHLSCIMLDLDHFKSINDRHGHAVGDHVLAAAATACRASLRRADAFGRVGGEEFAVLLTHSDAASALHVAEKLRVAIESLRIPAPAGVLKVTASLGVATLDRASTDMDGLMRNADTALYAAKHAGRNRCHAWLPSRQRH